MGSFKYGWRVDLLPPFQVLPQLLTEPIGEHAYRQPIISSSHLYSSWTTFESIFPLVAPVARMWFEHFASTDENVADLLGVVVAAREYAPLEQRNPL